MDSSFVRATASLPGRPTAADASRQRLSGMKRKLSTEHGQETLNQSQHENMKQQITACRSPADYVASIILASYSMESELDSLQLAFLKPTEAMIEAFKLEPVKAVRRNDVEALKRIHSAAAASSISSSSATSPLQCCNRFGESLLHMACRRGHVEMVRYLVEEANVSLLVRDDFGRTPLHDACWTSTPQPELVEYIVRKQPGLLLVPDVRGHTPLEYARREHWEGWIEFFSERRSLLERPASTASTDSASAPADDSSSATNTTTASASS